MMAFISSKDVQIIISKKGNPCLLLKQEDLFPKYKAIKGDMIYIGIDKDLLKRIALIIGLNNVTIFDYDEPHHDEMYLKVMHLDGRIFSGHLQEDRR